MKIETRLSNGDSIWYMRNDKVYNRPIAFIHLVAKPDKEPEVIYHCYEREGMLTSMHVYDRQAFLTKQELLDSL